jgi:hypothetical protein
MRAKFKCDKIDEQFIDDYKSDGKGGYEKDSAGNPIVLGKKKYSETLWFTAVYSADKNDVNYTWSLWTPSGQCNITVTNPECFGHFELGKEYYLDFNPVA